MAAESFKYIAREVECHAHKKYQANTCEATVAENQPEAIEARAALLKEFGKNFLLGIYLKDPASSGLFGSADIWQIPSWCRCLRDGGVGDVIFYDAIDG